MRTDGRESGYVLFGVVILIIILGISLAAAVPLWEKVVQRENEQELIWRGYQYMDAIERYQTKYPGAYPPNLEVLVEEKFLRQLYSDPMSEDGEWRVLRQMSPELQTAAQAQAGRQAGITGAGASPSLGQMGRGQGANANPGGQQQQQQQQQRQRQQQPRGGQFQSSIGRGLGDAALGGIVGVASASEKEPFYQVAGKEAYKDWLFVLGAQQQQAVGQPGGADAVGAAAGVNFGALPPAPGRPLFRAGGGTGAPGPSATPGAGPGENRAMPPGFQQPPGPPPGLGGRGQQQNPFGGQPGFGQEQPQQPQQQQRPRRQQR